MRSNKFSVVFRNNNDFVSLWVLDTPPNPPPVSVLAKKTQERTLGFYQEPHLCGCDGPSEFRLILKFSEWQVLSVHHLESPAVAI